MVCLFYHGRVYSRPVDLCGFEYLPTHRKASYCPVWALIDVDLKNEEPPITGSSSIWPIQTTSPDPIRWTRWKKLTRAALLGTPKWNMKELSLVPDGCDPPVFPTDHRSPVIVPFHSHHLSPLLCVYWPCSHSDRSQLSDATFSPCNPSLYDDIIVYSPLSHYHHPPFSTVQVHLLCLLAHQAATCGPLLDMLEVRHTLLHRHGHRPFGTPRPTAYHFWSNFGCGVEYRWGVRCGLLHPHYVSRARDTGTYFCSAAYDQHLCGFARWSESTTSDPPRIDVHPRTDLS